MNVKQMLDEYAAKNNNGKVYSNEQFVGKAFQGGIRVGWNENGYSRIARIHRDKTSVWIIEEVVNLEAQGNEQKVISSTEVARANY